MKNISLIDKYDISQDCVFVLENSAQIRSLSLSKDHKAYIIKRIDQDKQSVVELNLYKNRLFFYCTKKKDGDELYRFTESIRLAGFGACKVLNVNKIKAIQVIDLSEKVSHITPFLEGLTLGNYQFLKYFTKAKEKKNALEKIQVFTSHLNKLSLKKLTNLIESVYWVRDMVNEPVSYLNADQLAKEIKKLGDTSGFKVEIFNKKKIETLKMGGLLAVNKGSIDEPRFVIMEWKPKNAKNKKPIVLVGKGVVYDTGGLSLKPTKGSMDEMKCDMAGAATVAGIISALAKNQSPIHVIGLVPATDNRPGGNAYAPGDVVTTYSGRTVEVLNTDAEGRVILADALYYAQKYKPELVIDFATLTGAAQAAIGNVASVMMGTAPDKEFQGLDKSGYEVFERVVKFPFWKEYGDMILSDVADIKNVGSSYAGAITAGKFLEVFTKDNNDKPSYPWIHIDIAGPAFIGGNDAYRLKGGTGYGVRLIYDFLHQNIK